MKRRHRKASRTNSRPRTSFNYIEVADGRVWMLPHGVQRFVGDLPEQSKNSFGRLTSRQTRTRSIKGTVWRWKPSWYIAANNERTVQPELQRFAAKRMGATAYDIDSYHAAMLSPTSSSTSQAPARTPSDAPPPSWSC
jgi:hypothetical protein